MQTEVLGQIEKSMKKLKPLRPQKVLTKITLSTAVFFSTTVLLAVLLVVNFIKNPPQKAYDTTTVLNKIVQIGELATIRYNYSGVIGFEDNYKILNVKVPLTEKSFLLKYTGYVKAGVDFGNIEVDVGKEFIHVSMPKAKILDAVIDEHSVKVYNESDNAFNPIKIADYNSALIKEKRTMQQDAVTQGILREAQNRSEQLIRSLLEEMGFKEIRFTEEMIIPKLN